MGNLSEYLEHHPGFAGLAGREVARRLEVGINTALSLISGGRVPEDKTLIKVAQYLHPNAPEVQQRELAKLRELALLDTPFELPEGAQLLDLKERAFIRSAVNQLLESSGKSGRLEQLQPDEPKRGSGAAAGNVVRLHPPVERVSKAAYDPPPQE